MKILDIAVPAEPKQLAMLEQVNCNDLIHRAGHLIVSGVNGVVQYDMSQDPPVKLSEVLIKTAGH